MIGGTIVFAAVAVHLIVNETASPQKPSLGRNA
jgi:hypothetical protein